MQISKYQIYSHSDMFRVTLFSSYQILSNFGCSGPMIPSGAWSRKLFSLVYFLYHLLLYSPRRGYPDEGALVSFVFYDLKQCQFS